MANRTRKGKILRKRQNSRRKKQRGSGLMSAIGHRAHSAFNTVATVGKIATSNFKPPEIKFFNNFDNFSDIDIVQNINGSNQIYIVNLKSKFNQKFKFSLGKEESGLTSSWGTSNNYIIRIKKELNAYIFTSIKQLYNNVFNFEIDKYSGDNAYYTGYIFSTNRSSNALFFSDFGDELYKKSNNFRNVQFQKIFWINLFNLLKVYCSSEENESIPCLQLRTDGKFYCIYVNNYKRSKTRSINGIIDIPNNIVMDLIGKDVNEYQVTLNRKKLQNEQLKRQGPFNMQNPQQTEPLQQTAPLPLVKAMDQSVKLVQQSRAQPTGAQPTNAQPTGAKTNYWQTAKKVYTKSKEEFKNTAGDMYNSQNLTTSFFSAFN